MIGPRFIALWLISLAVLAGTPSVALAQGADTVYDEAGVLTDSQEQKVQDALDSAQKEAGQPIYAFLVPNTGVENRHELLTQEAREADVPGDAGAIMVAPKDRWDVAANLNGVSEEAVSTAMEPDFSNGDYASGLIAGAAEIRGEPVAARGNPDDSAGGLAWGGLLPLVLVAGVGALALFRNRRAKRRRVEQERRSAEEEFAGLTSRLDEYDEKERLVSGYLEAQRPLMDRRAEDWVEAKISAANTAGFAREFNEAASLLVSDPSLAREQMESGRELLAGAMQDLNEAERTMDDYRAADKVLDGRLRATGEEILAAERAGEIARSEGVAVEPLELGPEYDRLAREAADRASRRDEFDPRQSLAAVEALAQRARAHEEAVRDGFAARAALPDERHATEGALARARTALGEYRGAHERALGEFGQAALGETPNPGELSTGLLEAEGCVDRADRAASTGASPKPNPFYGRPWASPGKTDTLK